jgi:hypothetical protein
MTDEAPRGQQKYQSDSRLRQRPEFERGGGDDKPKGMCRVILNTLKTYDEIQNLRGYYVGLFRFGSLNLAQTANWMIIEKLGVYSELIQEL